jgi:hypothetical protein
MITLATFATFAYVYVCERVRAAPRIASGAPSAAS